MSCIYMYLPGVIEGGAITNYYRRLSVLELDPCPQIYTLFFYPHPCLSVLYVTDSDSRKELYRGRLIQRVGDDATTRKYCGVLLQHV